MFRVDISEELQKNNGVEKLIEGRAEQDIFVPRTLYILSKKEITSVFELLENYKTILKQFQFQAQTMELKKGAIQYGERKKM